MNRKTRKFTGFGWIIETYGDGELAVPCTEVDIETDAMTITEECDEFEAALGALTEVEVIFDDTDVYRIKRVEGVFLTIKIDGEWVPWVYGEDELFAIERLEEEYGDY
jgi:hypothetical protein